MPEIKILILSGSLRPDSSTTKLATLAARELEARGAAVTLPNLDDYALPVYDARIQDMGMPAAAEALHDLFRSHDGVFIATPEYNAFPSPLLLNTFDWVSRVKHFEGGTAAAFGRSPFAIGAVSPGAFGGYRGAVALRQKLELGLGAHVLPAMACVPHVYQAFDADGNFVAQQNTDLLSKVTSGLVAAADKSVRLAA